jgi:hypothetical protein
LNFQQLLLFERIDLIAHNENSKLRKSLEVHIISDYPWQKYKASTGW